MKVALSLYEYRCVQICFVYETYVNKVCFICDSLKFMLSVTYMTYIKSMHETYMTDI